MYCKLLKLIILSFVLFLLSACASTTAQTDNQLAINSNINLNAKIKQQLQKKLGKTSAKNIQVSTYRGTVLLSGTVASQEIMSKAVNNTRNIAGVKSVENSLLVR